MWCRYWIVLLSLAGGAAAGEVATTVVVRVEGTQVVLGAGRLDGLVRGAEVTLLREGDPIIHPLTGEELGVPQEPVGLVKIAAVADRQARGTMEKTYSAPMVDDLGEYERAVPVEVRDVAAAGNPGVGKVIERVEELEQSVKQYRKSSKVLSDYPVFAREVWDEMMAVKSYLVALDERLVKLEEQQGEDHIVLTSVLSGEYQRPDMEDFTIRYPSGTDVKLEIAGKTLVIKVAPDSLYLVEEGVEEELQLPEVEEAGEAGEAEEGVPWYRSQWTMGGVIALFGLIGLFLVYDMVKRRNREVMEGLEEFDEDYMEDEEE